MKINRLLAVAAGEFANFRPRLLLINLVQAALPITVGGRVRAFLLSLAGCQIGKGTAFSSAPRLIGEGPIQSRLYIGAECWFNIGCVLELGAPIIIGNRVTCGPEVMLLTTTHALGGRLHRCGKAESKSITVGDGAWLGARCVVLPGVTIGQGAVVAAGAIVNRDVPANSVVAGVPARVIRALEADEAAAEVTRNGYLPHSVPS